MIAGVAWALEVLRRKWNVHLLFLMARGVHRHGELLQCLPGVSKKVMTEALRALERDGLAERNPVDEVPPRVEYSLTALGWTMSDPLIALADWGATHASDVSDARTSYHEAGSRPHGDREEL
jgi:DNA-binding HxlR family transcriptional regulator